MALFGWSRLPVSWGFTHQYTARQSIPDEKYHKPAEALAQAGA
jgi:hypothetical protein